MFFPWRRNVRCFVLAAFLFAIIYFIISNIWPRDDILRYDFDEKLVHLGACKRPTLQLWPEDIKKIYEKLETVNCSKNEENWASFRKGKFQISERAIRKNGPIECKYQKNIRLDGDLGVYLLNDIKSIEEGDEIPHDVLHVKCAAEDGKVQSRVVLGVKPLPSEEIKSTSDQGLGLNIIMFGFDSVSSLTWQRSLKKSHAYFTQKLEGVVLESYNIVGDGTPQALLPILTGKTEEELPEARRGFRGAKSVDDHPWIWKELKEKGYVTQWGEDGANYGTFTYRMLGFAKQPVDHYIRPFYLADKSYSKSCFGSVSSHSLQLNYMREFIEVYGPEQRKFSFLFHSDYSHDGSKYLQNADEDLLSHLQWLNATGVLDNSLLILMSDHGARFTNLRSTEQGKYEERLPFFAVRLPSTSSFREKFPDIHDQLKENANLLTSPFDIHETMMDVLNYKKPSLSSNNTMVRPYPRGISLFQKIPKDRMCEDVGIKAHWCTCMRWIYESTGNALVQNVAAEVVKVINEMTKENRNLCAKLELVSIQSASVVRTRNELLSFKGSKDIHGRKADFSDHMKSNVELHQVTITTNPNNAMYEATVTYDLISKKMSVSPKDISRLDVYGGQPSCIASRLPHLRAYCYCVVE